MPAETLNDLRPARDARSEPPNPAEVYEQRFVPALFAPWAERVAEAAALAPGQRVLDVACGTGVLACAAARRVAPGGAVAGLDANEQMLAVARRKPAPVHWHRGVAEALPFDDASFDAVVSQFGLMFFDDRRSALQQMWRVLRAGGRLVVAVCDAVERSPGYGAFALLLQRLFGDAVADAFRAPFALGDPEALQLLCNSAGLQAQVSRHEGMVEFPSIAELVSTERACVWTLGGLLDDAQFDRLQRESKTALAPFVGENGRIRFSMPALFATARR